MGIQKTGDAKYPMTPESPHLREIKRMRKQCVPGTPPFFARAGDEAMHYYLFIAHVVHLKFVSHYKMPVVTSVWAAIILPSECNSARVRASRRWNLGPTPQPVGYQENLAHARTVCIKLFFLVPRTRAWERDQNTCSKTVLLHGS